MELYAKNTEHGLVPLYESDFEEKKKLKLGETYRVTVVKPRNYEFLKKFFALIRLGSENSKLDLPQEAYREYVIMKAGFFETYATDKGQWFRPKSISFSKMDEEEFQDVYSRVRDVISKDIGATNEEIDNELQNFY